MFKKAVSGAFAATLILAIPSLALACNWGVQASGDCKKLDVTVSVERGNDEKAGNYELYWSKDGNPKEGEKIATGEIPALEKGKVHSIFYDVAQNKNGKEGHYVFHLIEPKGSIWSKEIVVTNCTEVPPASDNGGTTTPPATDNGGTTTPPTTDNGGTTTPPTTDNGGTTTPPTTNNGGNTTPPATDAGGKTPIPVVTKPNGGKLPKTASSYPTAIVLGAALVAGGALSLRLQKQI
ncbi:LPXTG cell wall anchor domain-containing protein [Shimazuella sp. AN120528]|uniref:LPXTG cell wall anchor domain-containing protein n=1 Tax=Shimazuella soli TaxID=1892854 RepID=UPI001F0FCE19|nr:LPXTG cell wall anchor domain-containing protein [Shimazuella soli]MCH5584054.1 LPXTG cell wall anchor domain-containing protein [Shimazuella soli]